jgi:hypothetical protein
LCWIRLCKKVNPMTFFRAVPYTLLALVCLSMVSSAQGQTPPQDAPAQPTQAPGYIDEPSVVTEAVERTGHLFAPPATGMPKNGFYPEFGYMITGSGWISIGPGYHHTFADNRGLFDTSAAISWRAYKMAQARVEFHAVGEDRLTIGAQGMFVDWTQNHYYGLGSDTLKSDKGAYRLQDFDTVGWARFNVKPLVLSGTVGWLQRPDISSPAGPFKAGYTDARALFGDEGAPGLADPVPFIHTELSAAIDTRDEPHHAVHGGMYRVGWSTYTDRDRGLYSFQRYEAEAVQFVPLVPSNNWGLALHGWLVGSHTGEGETVPAYLLPSLGGHNTLRGYLDYRFHDRSLLLVSAESRWALMAHADLAVFVDAGNVAARVGDLDVSKTSVGVGVRVHTATNTFGRLDVAHSKEGWRLDFKLDDPFALSRLSRRAAPVPVVP